MQSDMVSPAKVASLRSFAGAGIPDSRLRAVLIRAGGDLNIAATTLLSDGALQGTNSPILVAAPSQTRPPPAQPAPPPPVQPKKHSASSVRRLAWRQFYRESYATAVQAVGSDKKAIDAFISELWKVVGSAKREEYTNAIRAQMKAEEAQAAGDGVKTNGVAIAREERKVAVGKDGEDDNSNCEVKTSRRRPADEPRPASGIVAPAADDNTHELHLGRSPAKRMRYEAPKHADVETLKEISAKTDPPADPIWPRKIASRLCQGNMLTSGKKLLAVNDEVILEVSPSSRGKNSIRVKGKRSASNSSTSKIVRFSKKGRELGRLAVDMSLVLAPALQSGFIETKCKVISAPAVCRMFSEVFLDVSLFLRKGAFDGKAEQAAAERGAPSAEASSNEDHRATEDGVDAKRVNVVAMMSSLKLCEPPEKSRVDFPKAKSNSDGDPGAMTEEDAEAYYNTVRAIDKSAANSFVPPRHLACTLREYQRAGVGWMVSREEFGSRAQSSDISAVDCMLDPLWKRRMFPDGGVFFINPTTGGLSVDAPIANAGGPYGGILADEMGLGKTVQCIACIVHDMEKNSIRKQQNGKGVKETSNLVKSPASVAETGSTEINDQTNGATNPPVVTILDEEDEITPVVKTDKHDIACLPIKQHTNSSKKSEAVEGLRRSSRRPSTVKPDYINADEDEDVVADESSADIDVDWNEDQEINMRNRARTISTDPSGDDDDFLSSPPRSARKPRKSEGKGESVFTKLMAAANSNQIGRGGTLIVCPTSLVTQWLNELQLHVQPKFLRAVAHYGQSRGGSMSISLQSTDVVVTTYGILASECPTEDSIVNENDPESAPGGPLFQLDWRRVILDEAHTIKSRSTKWARAAFRLHAERRWCVTGTVIHNHVNDVFSLLHFLNVKPWSSWAFWNRGIVANIESNDTELQKTGMSLLRDIISSMTLRRKKTTKDTNGQNIVHLPKKTVQIVRLVPSLEEKDFYDALHERSKVQFDTFVRQGKVMNNYASVLELLLRLRQACDHPYLVFAAAPSKDSVVMKDKDKLYKQFLGAGSSSQFIGKILDDARSGTLQESTTCPVCLDVIDDAVAPKECGHPACRSCLQESLLRSKKCPVCRVAISSDSVTTLPRATRFSVDLDKRWRSSAKLDALLKDVQDVESERKMNGGQAVGKTVIFSQFTSMLDLVGMALKRENFKSLRIDGSVPQHQRAEILDRFEKENELSAHTANILLVSLRAGGVGLNLVAACRAILLDIHWNPQVDAQAQDRVHRHGQNRDVVIKRYIVKDSVEERLLQVQDRKQDIADGALGVATDEDKKQARLSELKLLFSAS